MINKTQKFIQIWLPIIILLAVTKLLSIATNIPLRQFMLDPTEVLRVPFYTGIWSNLGVLLWTATASICLFISMFLPQFVSKAWRDFFHISGLLTIILLLDDLLRLHDEILPVYFGIKGDFLGIIFVFLIVLYLFRFRTLVFQYPYTFLVAALFLFAVSVAIDIAPPVLKNLFSVADLLLFEDGAKLLGIATWLAYFAYLGASVLSKANPVALKSVDDWTPATTSDKRLTQSAGSQATVESAEGKSAATL